MTGNQCGPSGRSSSSYTKFLGGPIKLQEISRISRISGSCRHPGLLIKVFSAEVHFYCTWNSLWLPCNETKAARPATSAAAGHLVLSYNIYLTNNDKDGWWMTICPSRYVTVTIARRNQIHPVGW